MGAVPPGSAFTPDRDERNWIPLVGFDHDRTTRLYRRDCTQLFAWILGLSDVPPDCVSAVDIRRKRARVRYRGVPAARLR